MLLLSPSLFAGAVEHLCFLSPSPLNWSSLLSIRLFPFPNVLQWLLLESLLPSVHHRGVSFLCLSATRLTLLVPPLIATLVAIVRVLLTSHSPDLPSLFWLLLVCTSSPASLSFLPVCTGILLPQSPLLCSERDQLPLLLPSCRYRGRVLPHFDCYSNRSHPLSPLFQS